MTLLSTLYTHAMISIQYPSVTSTQHRNGGQAINYIHGPAEVMPV